MILRADGNEERCPAKFLTIVNDGDVLRVRLAGGGGHGEPLERDPLAVLDDVREEKMTVGHARACYGVVVTGDPPAIDRAATEHLRRAQSKRASDTRARKPE